MIVEIRRNGLILVGVRPATTARPTRTHPTACEPRWPRNAAGPSATICIMPLRLAPYYNELWCTALAGLRVNYHPVYPGREDGRPWARKPLWQGGLMRGDCRVRMLNYISKTQVDCPVAVVFGHANAINWNGPGYANAGDALADAFWKTGFYADLIPTSEIESGALKIDEDGTVRYGNQRYSAVVLYHPEFEKPGTGAFFEKAAKGKTALYRMGDWTMDFDGKAIDGKAALPSAMTAVGDAQSCIDQVTAKLRETGIAPCTPAPPRSGQSRLIDGTAILAAGENNITGDPIQTDDPGQRPRRHLRCHRRRGRAPCQGRLARSHGGGRIEAVHRRPNGYRTSAARRRRPVEGQKGAWQGVLQDTCIQRPALRSSVLAHILVQESNKTCYSWPHHDHPQAAFARPPILYLFLWVPLLRHCLRLPSSCWFAAPWGVCARSC